MVRLADHVSSGSIAVRHDELRGLQQPDDFKPAIAVVKTRAQTRLCYRRTES
jgi:hypothetical protein